ncbi:MAG: L,D-transpeptidase [Candidatus Dormibacteraeota bacterium]|nr:L,D-transpeptidase [Candidatus Dormibacteraeota bacterium]
MVLVLVMVAGLGFGNQYRFNQSAARLHATWQQERAAGVSKAELAPLQNQLTTMEQQSAGPLPYPYYSMALFKDPLTKLQARSAVVYRQALAKTKGEAQADLTALQADYGPTPFDLTAHQKQLSAATTPGDYLKLAKAWTVEGAQVTASRDALSKQSGGLTGGLPTDVVNGKSQMEKQAQQLTQAKLWTDPEPATDTAVQTYLKQSYANMLQQHATITSQVSSTNQTLTARIQLSSKAQTLEGSIPSMIQQWGQNTNDQQQFQQDQQAVSAATNDKQLSAAAGSLQSLFDSLTAAKQKAQAAAAAAAAQAAANSSVGTTTCLPNKSSAPAQEIIISETNQTMVAYKNGCPWLSSYVTTGRPGLRTDVGTFHIFAKYPTYKMVSPWPKSSPYWYPTDVVPMAMEFVNDGTFLHGAPWEPDADMGPGSENDLAIASHGCVHIPSTVLPELYNWAQIGATVIVEP